MSRGSSREASKARGHLRSVPTRTSPEPAPEPAPEPVRRHHGGGSLRSRAVELGIRATVRPIVSAWSLTPFLPWPYALADQTGRLLRPVSGTATEVVELEGCDAHVVRNAHADSGRTVVYFQGGAFLVGGVHLHAQLISRIAASTGAEVVVPRFRKLPKHPVAAAVADGLAAYRHVLHRGADPADVVFAGDSAGGFLTFMVTVAARREGLPAPGAVAAMSPLIDLDPQARELRPGGCAMFGERAFRSLARLVERAHERSGIATGPATASPSGVELDDLPPTLIQVSSAESLYDDAERMAQLLAEAGVPVELEVWDHQVHVFQAAAGLLREADQALDRLVDFIDRTVPGAAARGRSAVEAG